MAFFLVQANNSDSYGISMTGRILPKAAAFSSGESWNGARSQNTLATKSSSQPLTQLWDLLFSSTLNYYYIKSVDINTFGLFLEFEMSFLRIVKPILL